MITKGHDEQKSLLFIKDFVEILSTYSTLPNWKGGGCQSLILRKNHVDFNLLVLEFDLKTTPPSKVNGEKSPTNPNY